MRSLREISIVCALSASSLVACSRQPEPKTVVPASDTASSAAVNEPAVPAAEEPPAESGLAIKRGVATLAQDHATFRPCDEKVELWMIDQTEAVLKQTFADELRNGPLTLYLEAYGERAPVAQEIPAARAYGGTFVLEEVLYAGPRGEARGCEKPMPSYIVAARGSEPFWAAEISDTQVVWRQPDAPTELDLGAPQTQDSEGAARYTASAQGHQVDLMIDTQSCRDSMSGEFFAYAAKAVFDGKEFSGCARVGK
jgi:uncharacterized membrane protein